MVEIADINDRASLERWLKGQSRDVSVWIARRAALRILPLYWRKAVESEITIKSDSAVLRVLRFSLISEVARTMPTSDIMTEAYNAAWAVFATNAAFEAAANAANVSANRDAAATFAANAAGATAGGAAPTVWKAIRQDCQVVVGVNKARISNLSLDCLALWHDIKKPLQDEWGEFKISLPDDWGFWIKWYDSVLDGKPLNGDMLIEIAQIENDDWEKGEARISFLIGEIQKRYAKSGSYYAEKIQRNEVTGKLETVPITGLSDQAFADAKQRMRDAVDKIRGLEASDNFDLKAMLADELDEIDDYLNRHADAPMRIYEVCVDTIIAIDARVDNMELSRRDVDLARFRRQLVRSSLDMLDSDAEISKSVAARASIAFKEFTDEERQQYGQITEVARQEAGPQLSAELLDQYKKAVDRDAPVKERDDSRYISGGRLIRMGEKVREESVKLADDAVKVNKAWDIVSSIWDWFI